MRACTLTNSVLKNNQDKRVYISCGGVLYEMGKVFVYDDILNDDGTVKEYGKVVLFADTPVKPKQETETKKTE